MSKNRQIVEEMKKEAAAGSKKRALSIQRLAIQVANRKQDQQIQAQMSLIEQNLQRQSVQDMIAAGKRQQMADEMRLVRKEGKRTRRLELKELRELEKLKNTYLLQRQTVQEIRGAFQQRAESKEGMPRFLSALATSPGKAGSVLASDAQNRSPAKRTSISSVEVSAGAMEVQ